MRNGLRLSGMAWLKRSRGITEPTTGWAFPLASNHC